MRAGELNEKITIKRVTREVNAFGDVMDATTIWKTGVRCKVMHLGTPSAGASEFNAMRELIVVDEHRNIMNANQAVSERLHVVQGCIKIDLDQVVVAIIDGTHVIAQKG